MTPRRRTSSGGDTVCGLDGYERRVKTIETTAAVAAGMQAWKAGRSKSRLLEGEDVPKQYPAARPFASRASRQATVG